MELLEEDIRQIWDLVRQIWDLVRQIWDNLRDINFYVFYI